MSHATLYRLLPKLKRNPIDIIDANIDLYTVSNTLWFDRELE
ncbi:hypothetical protein FDUTEX481_03665 [Tolypothrix sp. PCC 7601]|nr:hypothetical protein FDUTEX481_03665 [Tolypothrix sp. PCC 7601]